MDKISEVRKVWGKELWIVNRAYCGKILVLYKGHRCSMHRHPKKDETFYVIKGKVFMEYEGREYILSVGSKKWIAPGSWHRFSGLEDSEIVEFSTHHGDEDVERKELSSKITDFEKWKEKALKEGKPK